MIVSLQNNIELAMKSNINQFGEKIIGISITKLLEDKVPQTPFMCDLTLDQL